MKLNQILTLCATVAALALGTGTLLAQGNGGGPGGPGGGGFGGGGPGGGGGFGGGRMDPAQMQQQMMDRIRETLNFTNDTDWSAVQPLVQKVMDARRDAGGQGGGMMRGMFGRNRGGQGGPGGPGGQGGGRFGQQQQPSPEEEALQKALDDDAPAAQVKDLLAKYKSSQQAKQAKLETAQDALKAVLTTKQEAQAFMLGLVR
jgi:hypothetical protein